MNEGYKLQPIEAMPDLVVPTTQPIPKTVNEMLEIIDTFLSTTNSDTAGHLWNILAALRGPDSNNLSIKKATTTGIRRTAFPKTAKFAESVYSVFPAVFDGTFNPDVWDTSVHFNKHIQGAICALERAGREVK